MSETLRADAEQRRHRILEAAATVFSDEGVDISLDRVAKAAGVGVATLYRRFPDRASLVVAVVERDITHLLEDSRRAFEQAPSAWDALAAMMCHDDHGLTLRPQLMAVPEMAAVVRADPRLRRLRGELLDLLEEVVAAAQAEGSMRPDVGPGDVALMLSLVRRRPVVCPDAQAAASRRVGALVLAALSAHPGDLPGEPLLTDVLPFAAAGH